MAGSVVGFESRRRGPALRQLERHVRRGERGADHVQKRVRSADQPAGRGEVGAPGGARGFLRGGEEQSVAHHRLPTRGHHPPQRAVFADNAGRPGGHLDEQTIEIAPIAIVVLRVGDHREAEGVGDVANAHLHGESRKVRGVHAQRVSDDWLGASVSDVHGVPVVAQRMLRRCDGAAGEQHEYSAGRGLEHVSRSRSSRWLAG